MCVSIFIYLKIAKVQEEGVEVTWVILSESVREAFLEEVSLKHLAASDN